MGKVFDERLSHKLRATGADSERDHAVLPHCYQGRSSAQQPLEPTSLVTLDELALSNMWETSALVELLERKGILTRQEVLAMIQELRKRDPTAIPPRYLDT